MFHPRHTLTRDSSATHTTLALRIASINHTCGLNIAPYSSLMSWVCFIFIPMLCEPTTRKSILDLILLFGAQLFNMASAVQSRLDYHCNAIHMRSVPVEVIRIGRWLGRIDIIWLIQLRSKWIWCYGLWPSATAHVWEQNPTRVGIMNRTETNACTLHLITSKATRSIKMKDSNSTH